MSKSNLTPLKKKTRSAKQWKAAPSKPSATTAKAKERAYERAHEIVELLKKYYPDAKCSLNYESPYQLLVATVLSAQCTDERVNKVTQDLFQKVSTPEEMVSAKLADVEKWVRSTGFYKNKAKGLKASAEILVEKYKGQVPQELVDLVGLPGVGVKTANVVLGNAFGIASGIVVDTHVGRLSRRLGLADAKTPEKIQAQLEMIIEKGEWIVLSHRLIQHGRLVCKARRPLCNTCFLYDLCPRVGV